MNDDVLMTTVKDALSGVEMDTPVDKIMAAGRSRRLRRRSVLTAAGVAVAGLAIGVPAVGNFGATPTPPRSGSSPVQLAAFTVVNNPNGTATLTLLKGATLNPDSLSQALAGAGVPAIVRVGSFCDQEPGPDGLDRVLSSERRADGNVVLVFKPSAMPAGTKLSIGFKPESSPGTKDRVRFTLVTANAPLNCSTFK
ncbi:MAG TPA: hypothetical protein VGP57_07700 [Actinoplanes sp.]|jgi:hypothetical protein|nr:hypothetical protein [Actinoplanes sp.]